MFRSSTFTLAVACCGIALVSGGALAQGYPAKSVRVVVPFSPGGATDLTGRTVGAKLTESLKQTVVVENRTGAGGVIGADIVAHCSRRKARHVLDAELRSRFRRGAGKQHRAVR